MPESDIFGNIGILLFAITNSLKLCVSSKQKSNKKFKPNFRLLKYQENWKNFNETDARQLTDGNTELSSGTEFLRQTFITKT